MKRKDAFRKLRTICQRLDEFEPGDLHLQPQRLYLYGSVLTDKPDPSDVDLILVYEYLPTVNLRKIAIDMMRGRPTPPERAVVHLRRGMQMIRIMPAQGSLAEWEDQPLLLTTFPRLIWKPGGDWISALDEIEASPLPWPGPLSQDERDKFEAYVENLPEDEYLARKAEAVAKIEAQDLEPLEAVDDHLNGRRLA